jgi:hypothetical protein
MLHRYRSLRAMCCSAERFLCVTSRLSLDGILGAIYLAFGDDYGDRGNGSVRTPSGDK